MRALSELLRADARTRAELETRQGWVVNAARLAVAAPWIVLLLLGTQSTTLDAYNSAGGTLLLVVGAAVCVVAYRLDAADRPAPRGRAGAAMTPRFDTAHEQVNGLWVGGAAWAGRGASGVILAVRAAPPMRPVRLS